MIIFINGSINSGKSTIARLLADKLGNSALLEIDSLRNFIEWMPLEEAIPINLENTVAIIKVFVKNNINVIIPYPLDKENYNYLISELDQFKNDLHTFTLSPRLEVILRNRGSRELTDWERERINYHYNTGINNPDFGIIIDNSEEAPKETVSKILQMVK
ncbi:MAG: hypothetical protein PHI91_02640 [Candidatus Pacebacteria bacterium]|nr:hypothetical protein [Candidatus Paceibacterota bacterium]MDD2757406.1 hypothetical protein [Candidatus Paceibacterota bacterium]MDD3970063.1 hypothetical protein [Candidatus Paceibacterota bacterium]